jgi:TolA-binding protein
MITRLIKPMPEFLCVFLLAGAVAGIFFQQRVLWKARADNRQLREQSSEAQRLARENANLDQLREENRKVENLRNETRDLHKLRNEVRQLREQKPDLDKLRSENQRLRARTHVAGGPTSPSSDARPDVTKEMLADAGLGSPEAAIQTFFWAIRERNDQKIRACFSEEAGRSIRDQFDEEDLAHATQMMDTFTGFQIVAKKAVSADEIKLGIRVIQAAGQGESASTDMALQFKRAGAEWRISD